MTTSAATPAPAAGWFGHPAPLARLFGIEMWERFGYYGMRALLTLYLTKHVLLADRAASGLYGGYSALVYLTPLVGGLVADQLLGAKRAVRFGAALMALGYGLLALGAATSGGQARAWLDFDGARHPITIAHHHDGPTDTGAEARQVLVAGHPLTIKGHADGSIALVAADGQVARQLPAGAFAEGASQSPAMLALLLLALSTLAVGNGFFKPNISTMVGALYAGTDSRRDAGFTIFYMGINIGSILGQALCPLFADTIGWAAGFAVAGGGMALAFAMVALAGDRLAGLGERPAQANPRRDRWVYLGAIATIGLFTLLYRNLMASPAPVAGAGLGGYLLALPVMGKLLIGTFLLGVPALLAWTWRQGSRAEFEMALAAMALVTFNIVFWTLFEQAGTSLTLFADRNTDRSVFGLFELSAPQTQNFNPIAIVLLAPLMSALWGWLGRRGWEPSIPVKFGIALLGAGAGFLLLVLGGRFAGPHAQVGLAWLAGLYVIHSVAELCISPVGLSMITKLAIARVVGLMMGVWFLSISVAQYAAGMVAQMASVATVGGEVMDPAQSLATYLAVFTRIGGVAIALGLALLALARPLGRLTHGVR
ncbi:MAG TPA: peptide MFS transporter [Novosphingobium sp.]|nr:peptide MFS transporter [Novosphingobium sp.]